MDKHNCENCGADRSNFYCASCGQNDRDYKKAFPPMLWELLRETFDLDSRVLRTLGYLLFKPGELALEFSRNRRARYVSPIRLYLFISLAFFFILSLTTDIDPNFVTAGPSQASASVETDSDNLEILFEVLPERQHEFIRSTANQADDAFEKQLVKAIASALETQTKPISVVWRHFATQGIDAVADPGSTANAFIDNMPVAMFLLLPIFALILQLLYIGNHKFYVEHLVFATHLHSFTFIIYTVVLLLPENSNNLTVQNASDTISTVLVLTLALYHMISLKRYYGSSLAGTLFKFIVQMALYFIVLIPTAFLTVVLFTLLIT